MKIFLTASHHENDESKKYFEKISQEIKAMGYDLVSSEPFIVSEEGFDEILEDESPKKHAEFYKKKIKGIQQSDICIFDATNSSLAIGFVIQKSLEYNKPTVILYYKDHTPYFLSGIEHEKLIIHSYNEKIIKKVLREVIEIACEKRDKRFNFFISPKLLDYLERASSMEGVTKSKFIRNLIFEHMEEKK